MKKKCVLLLLLPLLIVACGSTNRPASTPTPANTPTTASTPTPAITPPPTSPSIPASGEYADASTFSNFSLILDYQVVNNTTISTVTYITTYCKTVWVADWQNSGWQNQRFVDYQTYQSNLSIDQSGTVTLTVRDSWASESVLTGTFDGNNFNLYSSQLRGSYQPQEFVLTPASNEFETIISQYQQKTCA